MESLNWAWWTTSSTGCWRAWYQQQKRMSLRSKSAQHSRNSTMMSQGQQELANHHTRWAQHNTPLTGVPTRHAEALQVLSVEANKNADNLHTWTTSAWAYKVNLTTLKADQVRKRMWLSQVSDALTFHNADVSVGMADGMMPRATVQE